MTSLRIFCKSDKATNCITQQFILLGNLTRLPYSTQIVDASIEVAKAYVYTMVTAMINIKRSRKYFILIIRNLNLYINVWSRLDKKSN